MSKNRYENISALNQHFTDSIDGKLISVVPGGTVLADEKSAIARSRFTKLVQKNVKEQSDQDEDELEAPVHANQNPTNTTPTKAKRSNDTVLTDDFDGAGDAGAVNTSAAPSSVAAEIGEKLQEAAEAVEEEQGDGATEIKSTSTPSAVEKGKRSNRK